MKRVRADDNTLTKVGRTETGRESFSGRFIAALAMLGVSIGLGNVWRFPYMLGAHGGSAFLLVYVVLALAVAMPALVAEWALGRGHGGGPVTVFRAHYGRAGGSLIAAVLVISLLIANSYYIVVIAQILELALDALRMGFAQAAERSQAGGARLYALALTVLALATWVIAAGVRAGIERVSRWFVPLFGLIVIALVFTVLGMADAIPRLLHFLRPDFSTLGAQDVFAAMGQAVFSLGVGGSIMLTYGSYLRTNARLVPTAVTTTLGDVGGALLAALFIVPAALVFSIDLAAGPGLVFSTLPALFARMTAGNVTGFAFLIAFLMMAFLSAVAALEVGMSAVKEASGARMSRPRIALLLAALEVLLIAPSAWYPEIIGTLDMLFGSGMQLIGALLAVLAFAHVGKAVSARIVWPGVAGVVFTGWLRWVVPVVLAAVGVTLWID